MSESWWPWIMRAVWVTLPFLAGPVFADALDGTSRPVQVTATIGLWVSWAVGMALVLIPHTVTLTPFRILAPATLAGALWATLADGASGWAVVALAVTAATTIVSLSPQLGAWFVNGSSYGDERRIPLRPPATLLVGPIPVAWAAVVAGLTAGPMLLAARQWIGGGAALVVGIPVAVFASRALHALAKRWLVFVPAGLVVHDHWSLPDPVLFKRSVVRTLGPALADTAAQDLSLGALGLALELQTTTPVEIAFRTRLGADPTASELDAIVISASRPGAVLAEARRRRITVG